MNSRLNSLINLLDGPVLVTGHTGFKGTWLTLLLEELGVEVVGYSLAPEVDSLYSRIGREGKILEEYADIRNLSSIQNFIMRTKPVAVFHLAAQPLVMQSYKSPRETFETNVLGTVNLLDAAFQANSVKAVIAITTDKVYRNDNSGFAFKESDALSGKDPYSASKVGSEAAIAAWRQIAKSVGGPKVVATRAGNVIGGGDWANDRLIPDLVRGFSQGKTVQVRNPLSTRPWQHVLDPLLGYICVLQEVLKGGDIEAINFGPKEASMRVSEVVEIASRCWGVSSGVILKPAIEKVYEANELELNSDLAIELLDWKPVWSQAGAVEATIEWWKGLFHEEMNPRDLCEKDIKYALKKIAQ
jgi:CDP-glucose 4,6-dehydratase